MLSRLVHRFRPRQKDHPDDFIRRLRSLVIGEGMLRSGNIPLMELAIRNMPEGGAVIEIGSYGGLSTNLLVHLLRQHEKDHPLFNCDAWIYEGYHDHQGNVELHIDGRTDVSRTAYSAYMKNAFLQATQFLSAQRLPHSFHAHSDVFLKKWENQETDTDLFGRTVRLGGPVSFAYIDGGHSYEVASNDFEQVASHLSQNGYILLDDSADHLNFGSARMMAAVKRDKRFTVVAKNPNYLIQRTG